MDQALITASNAASCTTTAVSCKRKASAGHPDAPPASRRHQNLNQDEDALPRLAAGQVVERGAVATARVKEAADKLDRVEAEDSLLLHGDRPASRNGGSTTERRPIIVIDGDDTTVDGLQQETTAALNNGGAPSTDQREPATPWRGGDNAPFGYKTWDPTDGGRYELLSTYLPPPCLDGDLEDALWGLAATSASPDLYASPADAFWGTPDGVWTLY